MPSEEQGHKFSTWNKPSSNEYASSIHGQCYTTLHRKQVPLAAQAAPPVNSALVKHLRKLFTGAKQSLIHALDWHSRIKPKYFSTAVMLLI